MTPVEQIEIKGLNLRSIFWLVCCTGTIMITVLTVYFQLRQQIDSISNQSSNDLKYNDLRMRNLEQKVDINSIIIRDIQIKTKIEFNK